MTKVFVHGNPETEAIWGPLVDALSERGLDDHVVPLSPPGFGSPAPDGWDPTPRAYVSWLADRLRDLDGPIDLVGHDWGAGHVFGLLAEAPELVRSWAADCAGLLHPDYMWHDMAQVWQAPEAGEDAVAAQLSIGIDGRMEIYTNLGLPTDVAEALAGAFDDDMGRCILGLYRGAAQPALAELGRKLTDSALPPGLVLDPSEDAYVDSTLGVRMVEPLGADHLRLEGNGHWWMIENPDRAADGLLAFWAGLTDGQ